MGACGRAGETEHGAVARCVRGVRAEGMCVRQEAGSRSRLPIGKDRASGRDGWTAARRPGRRVAANACGLPATAAAR
eukprot:6616570-Alexandrium_andersonii.AAC.1